MGNDGGSIPRRIELVKEKQKDVKQNPDIERSATWLHCALSKLPLEQPVVSDALGKLYNQDSVIEYILDKTAYGDGDKICSHITSTKDIVKLNLAPNPGYDEKLVSADATTMGNLERDIKGRFICPVSMKEMNGKHRFVYLSTCGCAFAEQALKEIQTKECVSCGKPYTSSDIVLLNPTKEELEPIKKAMEANKLKQKAERKAKKAARLANMPEGEVVQKKRKRDHSPIKAPLPKKILSGSSTTTAVMNKVAQELAEREKKKPVSDAVKSIYADKGIKGNYLTMGTFNRYA
ncbi:Rtf2 RING-finger-domain-containing protein [Phycomyces blakesleeanus]